MIIYATEQQVVVTVVLVVAVALVSLFTGILWGHRMSRKELEEEERWAREQAAARRAHPVYREPMWQYRAENRALAGQVVQVPPEVAHEERTGRAGEGRSAWLAWEDQALTLANDRTLGGKLHDVHGGPGQDCWCGCVGHWPVAAAITTGKIQAITDERPGLDGARGREASEPRNRGSVGGWPDQPAAAGNDPGGSLLAQDSPITTGEIQAITDEMDTWIAVHITGREDG